MRAKRRTMTLSSSKSRRTSTPLKKIRRMYNQSLHTVASRPAMSIGTALALSALSGFLVMRHLRK